MRSYPMLPDPPEPTPGQDAMSYGLTLFRFVLAEGVTATLTDEQVQLAHHATLHAVCGHYQDRARESIRRTGSLLAQAARHRAARTLDHRPTPEAGRGQEKPNLGPMAPLTPTPDTEPPNDGGMPEPWDGAGDARDTEVVF